MLQLLLRKGLITTQDVREVKENFDIQMGRTIDQATKSKLPKWIDQMVFSGDLRLRVDNLDYEDSFHQPDRLRFRFRLRLGVETKPAEWITIGARLASGDGDPLMANQTFTDSFRRKPINIDAAYVALQLPGDDLVKVIAGKMPNPVWQPLFGTPIFYDPDLMPEGIAEQFTWRFGDRQQYRLFANFGQFAVKELSTDANDVYFYDFEAGAEARLPHLRLTAAGGYYLTQNLRNLKVGDAPNTTGNTVAISKNVTNYFADFNVIYARAEAAWNFSDKPLLGTPSLLTLSGEYDNNLAGIYGRLADAQTTGWAVQLMLGEARKKGQWQVLYEYKYVEADAIWDALADSDYGLGGTDRKGHVIRFAYNLQDWWQLAFNTSITRKISKRPNTPCHNQQGINGEDLLRWQVDSTFKF